VSTIVDVLAGRAEWAFECRDGFALARELGNGAVAHVIGDPPYNARTHDRARSLKDGGSDIAIDFAVLPPLGEIIPSLVRAAMRWTILFCALEQLGAYETAGPNIFIRSGLWVRTNGTPQISGDRPAQGGEGIALLHRVGPKRWNRHGDRGVWTGPRDADPLRVHPTKKPLWLMEALLRDFTDPGDLVFDPTAGEGTTGEACIKLGRRFIGCEIDPKYHAAGLARLTRAAGKMRQAELFA
jgi:site-specific DNA-methyltransferase (adenine-specific)